MYEERIMKKETKVLVLLGSPRREGNSAVLAGEIAAGARSAGAGVEMIYLHGLNIAPCRSCYHCRQPGSTGCAIDDDMQGIYAFMKLCDAWVIASPVYWFTMSAQTKTWMDRCFAFPAYGKDAFGGKRIAIAMSYGGDDPFDSGCVNALRTFQDAFGYVGARIVGMVYGSAMGAREIASDKAVLEAARDLGRKLAASGEQEP